MLWLKSPAGTAALSGTNLLSGAHGKCSSLGYQPAHSRQSGPICFQNFTSHKPSLSDYTVLSEEGQFHSSHLRGRAIVLRSVQKQPLQPVHQHSFSCDPQPEDATHGGFGVRALRAPDCSPTFLLLWKFRLWPGSVRKRRLIRASDHSSSPGQKRLPLFAN